MCVAMLAITATTNIVSSTTRGWIHHPGIQHGHLYDVG